MKNLILSILVLFFSFEAYAQTQAFDGWYRLKTQFQGEGKCLEGNQAGSKVHGGAAFMDDCQNVSGQLWKIEDAGNGYYRLKTQFRGEGECLESNNGTNPAFMDKVQNVSGQLWKIEDAGNGWYRLKSMFRGEGECLEGNQASSEYRGGSAFMDKCQNVSGQLWKFVKEGTPTPTKTEAKPVPTKPTIDTGTPIQGGGTTKAIATENIKAFVWYDQPTKPSFTPSTSYQYNSVGGAITGERIGQGQYKLTIPNMAKHYDGACHVTAYSGNHSAQVERWAASGDNLQIFIRVFDAKGAPTDGRFSAMFYKETRPTANSAYLWASNEGSPNHKYLYNGKGAISMKKTGTGVYQVTFEGIQMERGAEGAGGNVIATPYGTAARRIQVVSWLVSGNKTVATVHTYDFNGEPADTRFVLSYNGDWTNQAAYVWGNAATKTTQYAADKSYQMNNVSTDENMVTRLGAGSYKVTLPGIKNANASNAIAVAYGNNKAYASIERWGANGGVKGTDVYVKTYTADGQPTDSQFSLLYTTNMEVK
ncbi:MAG: RICIN domain-containing protein [Chitinophagales bacterium]